MKVIFLDFDGVLNSARFAKTWKGPGAIGLDPVAVERLNRLVDATDAKVVVSSSWRIAHSAQQLDDILREAGFRYHVWGVTPERHELTERGIYTATIRGDEIQAWLDGIGSVDQFVILDDDSDMGHLSDRLVKTTWADGLLDEHVDRAIAALIGLAVGSGGNE